MPHTITPEGAWFLSVQPTVTVPVDPSKLPAGMTINEVRIMKAPAGSADYGPLNTKVVDATHVSAKTYGFSTFVPASASASPACITDSLTGQKCCRDPAGDPACKKQGMGQVYAWQCTDNTAIFRVEDKQGGKTCVGISGQYDAWCCSIAQ